MATTISNITKTSSSISGTTAKTTTSTVYTAIGPGNDYETIYSNRVDRDTFSGGAGSKDWAFSGLSSNTQYGLVAFAVGGGDSEVSSVSDATLPAPASTISLKSRTTNSATFTYSTPADGGYYSKTIEYSIDGGTTWHTAATVSTGATTTGEFAITGLVPGSDYSLATRVSTTAGATSNIPVQFSTIPVKKVYGSVSGAAEHIIDLYGGSNSGAQRITKLYGSVGGETKLIHQGFGHITYT